MRASPLVLGRLLSALLTLSLPLGLARLLDPQEFGTYKQLFLVAQTALLIGQLGLLQSLYYFLPRAESGRGRYVTQALLGLTLAAVVAAGLLCLAAPRALHGLKIPLALLAAGLLVSALLEPAFTSQGRAGRAAVAYVVSDGTRAAILLLAARWGGISAIAWGAAAYAGLRVAALAAALALGAIPVGPIDRRALGRQLRYALPIAGAALLWVAQKQFIQYAVAWRFDTAGYAGFAVATFHLALVDILYTPVGEVLMVRLGATEDVAGRLREWQGAVGKLALVLWPATVCAWLFGDRVLPLLFTGRYGASVPLFLLATCEIPCWIFPVDSFLRASGATRLLFYWAALRLPLTAVAVLAGLALRGLAGAIVGSLLIEALSRAVLLVRARRELGVPLLRFVHGRRLALTAAAALGAVPGALVVERWGSGKLGLVLAALVYGVGYLGLTACFGADVPGLRFRSASRTAPPTPAELA